MNEQYFGERVNTLDVDEPIDPGMNRPVIENSGPFADKVLVDAALIHETPMDETFPTVEPVGETIVHEPPMDEPTTYETPVATNAGSSATLLNPEESEHFRTSWNEIQGKFVDEPRSAVQQADALVAEVIGQITQMFSNEHSSLESQWNQGGNDVSTEDLRKALQRYRSFFNRLVV